MNFKSLRRFPVSCSVLAEAAVVAVALWLTIAAAYAQGPRRIVSINLCTDQLVLALADPATIAALGRYSRNAEMSFLGKAADSYPSLRGSAEEVLKLKPDLVVAGAFSGAATRQMLMAHGVRVETFTPPVTIAAARVEVQRMADLLGRQAEGAILLSEIDAALARASTSRARHEPVPALALERRGFVSGHLTLLSDLMETAGFRNAAGRLGINSVDRAPLEAIVKLRPEVLIVEDLARTLDQSSALLLHPVLGRAGINPRVVKVPVAEMACGGSAIGPLLDRLSAAAAGAADGAAVKGRASGSQ